MSDKPKIPTTPEGRVAYPRLFKAGALKPTDTPKFDATLVWGPTVDLSEMKGVVEAFVKREAPKKWPGGIPKKFTYPWRSGDEKEGKEGFGPDDTFAAFRRNEEYGPPVVVGQNPKNPLTPADVYGGMIGKIAYRPYLYDYTGNCGVALGLEGFQKTGMGTPIGVGPIDPEDAFDLIEDDDLASALA